MKSDIELKKELVKSLTSISSSARNIPRGDGILGLGKTNITRSSFKDAIEKIVKYSAQLEESISILLPKLEDGVYSSILSDLETEHIVANLMEVITFVQGLREDTSLFKKNLRKISNNFKNIKFCREMKKKLVGELPKPPKPPKKKDKVVIEPIPLSDDLRRTWTSGDKVDIDDLPF